MKPIFAFFRRFFRELLLPSGQFALFYLFMQFSIAGAALFGDLRHTALIAPLCYSLLQGFDSAEFLLNAAHAGFWVFSLVTRRPGTKAIHGFSLTVLNVVIFLSLSFSFGALRSVNDTAEMALGHIFSQGQESLGEPTPIDILAGGFLLAFGLGLGRTEVVRRHGGVVDKFVGDTVMVLVGPKGEVRERLAPELAALCEPVGRWHFKGRQQAMEVWSLGSGPAEPAR